MKKKKGKRSDNHEGAPEPHHLQSSNAIREPSHDRANQYSRKIKNRSLNSDINRVSTTTQYEKRKQNEKIETDPEKEKGGKGQYEVSGQDDRSQFCVFHQMRRELRAYFGLKIKKGKSGCRLASLEMIF